MKPYATYKPSGVPWLGDVPGHWDVLSLRHAMDGLAMNGLFKKSEEFGRGTPLVNVSDLFQESFAVDVDSLERVACTPEEIEKYAVQEGDLFLVRSSLKLEGIAQFAVARVVKEPTVFECHIVRIRPDLVLTCPLFLSYYLNAPFARQSLVSRSKTTTMTTIDQNEALSTPMLLPLLDEQRAIADYLDVETARIDTLIHEKEELIGLLREARTSVIDRAVQPHQTKAAPLKRYVKGIATGPFGSALHADDYVSGGAFLINPTHIVHGKLAPDADVSLSDEAATALGVYRFKAGDIVVGRRGEMGRCAVVPDDGEAYYCGTGCLMLFPDTSKVVPSYLAMVISSTPSKDWLSLESVGSTMENLNSEILARLPCFIPSIDEQICLLAQVQAEIVAYDNLLTYVQEEITLLKELRAATIADAVLGRIDVRTIPLACRDIP